MTRTAVGYVRAMTDDARTEDDDRIATRAELLREEKAAGSDDPEAQAEAILDESEERIASRDVAPSTHLEHRTSEDATEPID